MSLSGGHREEVISPAGGRPGSFYFFERPLDRARRGLAGPDIPFALFPPERGFPGPARRLPPYFGRLRNHVLRDHPAVAGADVLGLVLYYGLLSFLPYLADRFLAVRTRGFAATLVFPAAAVLVEYVNALALGDWGSLAFSQPGLLPLQQVLSLTGIGGLTFLICWFGAVVNWVWESGPDRLRVRRGMAAFAGVLVAVLFYGGLRLALAPPRSPTVRVAGLTELRGKDTEQAFKDRLFARTRACASAGARIILWPEAAIDVDPADKDSFLLRAREEARSAQVYLLVTYYEKRSSPPGDRAGTPPPIGPDGQVLWEYVKTHPVPGSTDRPGKGIIPVVDTPYGRIGSAICYDFDFPALIRPAGRKSVDIMLDPSWDWRAIDLSMPRWPSPGRSKMAFRSSGRQRRACRSRSTPRAGYSRPWTIFARRTERFLPRSPQPGHGLLMPCLAIGWLGSPPWV